MIEQQERTALIERFERLKRRANEALEGCRLGRESLETATLAVLDLGRFTIEATDQLVGLKGER